MAFGGRHWTWGHLLSGFSSYQGHTWVQAWCRVGVPRAEEGGGTDQETSGDPILPIPTADSTLGTLTHLQIATAATGKVAGACLQS